MSKKAKKSGDNEIVAKRGHGTCVGHRAHITSTKATASAIRKALGVKPSEAKVAQLALRYADKKAAKGRLRADVPVTAE